MQGRRRQQERAAVVVAGDDGSQVGRRCAIPVMAVWAGLRLMPPREPIVARNSGRDKTRESILADWPGEQPCSTCHNTKIMPGAAWPCQPGGHGTRSKAGSWL